MTTGAGRPRSTKTASPRHVARTAQAASDDPVGAVDEPVENAKPVALDAALATDGDATRGNDPSGGTDRSPLVAVEDQPEPWRPRPARGYSWPPFQRGHTLSMVHGANHEPTIEARAAEVREHLFELAPWCATDVFVPAVARYLRAEARELLIHDYITGVAADKGVGAVPVRLWEMATACSNAAMKASALLGLDPQSYSRLRAVTGHAAVTEQTLADVEATGRAARIAAGQYVEAEADDDEAQ